MDFFFFLNQACEVCINVPDERWEPKREVKLKLFGSEPALHTLWSAWTYAIGDS